MECSLKNIDHSKVEGKYLNHFVNCALFNGKQICFWCCLHISEITKPTKRADMCERFPEYERLSEEIKLSWDEIGEVCGRCSSR